MTFKTFNRNKVYPRMYVMTLSLHVANLTRYKITFIDECVVHTGRSKPPSTRNSNNLHAQRLLFLAQNNLSSVIFGEQISTRPHRGS